MSYERAARSARFLARFLIVMKWPMVAAACFQIPPSRVQRQIDEYRTFARGWDARARGDSEGSR